MNRTRCHRGGQARTWSAMAGCPGCQQHGIAKVREGCRHNAPARRAEACCRSGRVLLCERRQTLGGRSRRLRVPYGGTVALSCASRCPIPRSRPSFSGQRGRHDRDAGLREHRYRQRTRHPVYLRELRKGVPVLRHPDLRFRGDSRRLPDQGRSATISESTALFPARSCCPAQDTAWYSGTSRSRPVRCPDGCVREGHHAGKFGAGDNRRTWRRVPSWRTGRGPHLQSRIDFLRSVPPLSGALSKPEHKCSQCPRRWRCVAACNPAKNNGAPEGAPGQVPGAAPMVSRTTRGSRCGPGRSIAFPRPDRSIARRASHDPGMLRGRRRTAPARECLSPQGLPENLKRGPPWPPETRFVVAARLAGGGSGTGEAFVPFPAMARRRMPALLPGDGAVVPVGEARLRSSRPRCCRSGVAPV